MSASSPGPERPEFGPSGYLPERASKRARKIVLRAPLGTQWIVASILAGLLVVVAGGLYLQRRDDPPPAPWTAVGRIDDLADSLFGEEAVSLALVGTSYTRIDDWNFVGFLKEALQRDLVSVALEARGPFQSMNEFLAGPAAKSGELQTVIWEFPLRTLLAQRQIPSPLATPETAQH
jgi:hypothetical protein